VRYVIAHIHTSTRSPPDDVPAYPSAESTIASSESAERVDGASRPMKAASAHDVISGTSVRKTMTVSTLAACSIFMFVKIATSNTSGTIQNARTRSRSSGAHSSCPRRPSPRTTTALTRNCSAIRLDGYGKARSASLFTTIIIDEQST